MDLPYCRSVGNQEQNSSKSEEIEAEARKWRSLRSCRKIVENTEEQGNGSIGLGEVPAPQFIDSYTQLQIECNDYTQKELTIHKFSQISP